MMTQHPPTRTARRLDGGIALLLTLIALTFYGATAVPGPFDGDYGEFQYMPRLLGLPHPTGYPLFLLLGWSWSWLPLGSLALRLNLFSTFWAAITLALLFALLRQQRLPRVAALGGALALALVPAFWRYAGLAATYTLLTALLAAALWLWLCWGAAPTTRRLVAAPLVTGLALTNHPTAAFLVPGVALFVLAAWLPRRGPAPMPRPTPRALGVGVLAFALPGLLYLYVPLRLWAIGPGEARAGLSASIAQGYIAPFLDWHAPAVVEYITGQALLTSYAVQPILLLTRLPGLLVAQMGLAVTLLGAVGAIGWLVRRPRGWLMLAALFLPAAAYAVSYDAEFASRNQIAHLEAHLLPALLVWALWAGEGLALFIAVGARLGRPTLTRGLAALLLVALIAAPLRARPWPTDADRAQSEAIRRYWSEVLAYPLEPRAALAGHWGDLTALWYFQHGEGRRPDLWALFPPDRPLMERWLAEETAPLYLAGPLLGWSPELAARQSLTPWGILVRIAPPGSPPTFPPMVPQRTRVGGTLRLHGSRVEPIEPGRSQLWLAWQTEQPTPRDLALSLRLHGPDGALLLQQDGRLASLWYPEGTLPAGQPLLSIFDLTHGPLPPGTVARLVVYDPLAPDLAPLLTDEGADVWEIGPFAAP